MRRRNPWPIPAAILSFGLLLSGCDDGAQTPTNPAQPDAATTFEFKASDNPASDVWSLRTDLDGEALMAAAGGQIGTLTPESLEETLSPGETVTENKTASLPGQADVVDIVFAFDNTGSMGGELDNLKVNATDIMTSLGGLISDVRFGLVSFADYDAFFTNTVASGGCDYAEFYGFTGDLPYVVNQTLDADIGTVATAIGALSLSPGGGADLPESYSRALYELAQELLGNTGPDGPVNWRPEARRIVILFGDAFPHDCDTFDPVEGALGAEIMGDDFGIDPGRDGMVGTSDDLDILDVLADLVETDITLISLHSVQTPIPGLPEEPSLALWTFYAEETGGTNFEINTDGSFPAGTNIVETILDLVGEQISTVDELILDVCPGDEGFSDWIVSVDPGSHTNIDLPADRDFELVLGPPAGTAPGLYEFEMCAIGDGAVFGSQTVAITVPGGGEDPQADVTVTKTPDSSTALVGDDITWTVDVMNDGPDDATNVVVTDPIPSGVTPVSAIPSTGSCEIDSGVLTCALGDLAAGADASIEIVTTADEEGTVENTADVESDVADPNQENNSSTASVNVTQPPGGECVVIEFENTGSHLSTVASFELGGSTIDVSVEPGGARSQSTAALYDTDTSGGPDADLEWDGGTCSDCAGQGNVLIIPDLDPATNGDSGDGGVMVMTGFPAGGFGFNSLTVIDSDEAPYTIEVDGSQVGASTPGADGNVESVGLDTNVISSEVRIDLGRDSGAVDDLEFCATGG